MQNGQWGLASTLVFCSIIAAVSTMQTRSASAANDCLSAPKDSTPQGKHWYYRVERQTKRACWYLGEEGRSTSRSSNRASAAQALPEAAAPDKTATQQNNNKPLQPAIADAHAELSKAVAVPFMTMPPIAPQPNRVSAPRETPALQTNEPAPPDSSRFTERWPDAQTSTRVAQADVAAPAAPVPIPARPMAPPQTTPQQAAASVAPATVVAAPDDSSDMLRIILAVLTATIALAAIVGRLILTHMRPRKRPAPRRPIWQTTVSENADPVHARASHSALRARAEADVEELLRALRYPEPPRVTLPIASANRGRRPTDRSGARA